MTPADVTAEQLARYLSCEEDAPTVDACAEALHYWRSYKDSDHRYDVRICRRYLIAEAIDEVIERERQAMEIEDWHPTGVAV